MSEDSLRASDADREKTVARLQQAFAEGRLELAEMDERTAAAYAAKTLGDLAALTRDLPAAGSAPVPPQPQANPAPAPQSTRPQHNPDVWRWAQYGLPPVIVISFVVWVASGLTSHWTHPWWIWIIVAWVCGGIGRHRCHRGHLDHRGRRGIERRRDQWERDRRDEDEDD
ncbi:MAG TPA: DUF1707 domain-containing protein [Mycobacteriales bacterium]|nr:DUF1707 domain-containing protein [Mycobacteriales bacterium]